MISVMQFKNSIFSNLVILLLITGMSQIQIFSSEVVWEDNFSDQNLDDWIITRGVFSAENCTLWAYGTETTISNRAFHDCNVTVGSWRFDILLRYNWYWRYHPPQIRFMVNSTDDISWSGYVLDFYTLYRANDSVLALYLRVHTDAWKYLAHFDYNIPANGWQDVKIQRTSNGRITVFMNNSMIIDVTDDSLLNGSYFAFDSEDCVQTLYDPLTNTESLTTFGESPMLDNIQVIETSYLSSNNAASLTFIISSVISGIAVLIIIKEELGSKFEK